MVRRKATRGQAAKKNIETSDPDSSMIADGEDQVRLKKEAYLRDMDIQYKARLQQIQSDLKTLLKETTSTFNVQKMTITKGIRNMKIQDFIDQGGDLKLLELNEISEIATKNDARVSFSEATLATDDNKENFLSRPADQRPTRASARTAPGSQQRVVQPRTAGRGRPTRKMQSGMMTPLNTTKSANQSTGTGLPTVTPKFDPREPVTTARKPKDGETLLSFQGSPVVGTRNRESIAGSSSLLSLTLNKQQTLLSGSLFDATANMSPGTLLQSKERLQEVMDTINSKLSDLTNSLTDSTGHTTTNKTN